MKIILDEHLPPQLVEWFAAQGIDAQHVRLLEPVARDDLTIAQIAAREHRIVISKDQDFLYLQELHDFTLIWLRCGNISNDGLRALLDRQWSGIAIALADGETLVELR